MTIKPFLNQSAIVTGAGVGIGYEVARQLALAGASVLLNDLDSKLAEQAAQEITREGGMCQGVGGDIADVETVRGLVSKAVELFGRLDIAVANAGLTLWADFFDYEPTNFDRVLNVNLRGSYFLAQAAARQMRAQGQGGRIVFMSSVTGHQAIRYLSTYGMTKAALEMLARNLVVELSPYHITVNCVAPGATVTPRNLADDPNYEAVWGQVIPTGRAAIPADIAQAVLFFLSPHSGQITGQTLIVDGGWTAVSPTPALNFVEKTDQ
ncbi:MAG: SDR family oxidoreductase [Anaerolineae bacterium]|nr:SDR family oxidoreductase [Anaerolineae bacterium]